MVVIQFPQPKGCSILTEWASRLKSKNSERDGTQHLRACKQRCGFATWIMWKPEARAFIDADILDETGSQWADTIDYLEATIAIMKAALVRLEVSEDRALGRKRRIK
jgi:hypothetical protein